TRGSFDYVRALVADPANERIDVFHARSLTPAMRDYAAELFGAAAERVRYIAMGETPDWLERAATGGPYTYHFWCEDALGLHVGQLPMLGPAIAFTCADLAPVQFADVYWYGQDETYIRALWRRQGAPERFIENYRFLRSTPLNLPKPSAVRARAEIGVGPAETLLASVGNRLGRELDQPFVDGLAGFLLKRPNVRWMAVGGLPDYWTSAFGRVLGRQFIHVLYDEDLAGLLGICDVFANPFRVGGGHSSVIAIDAGAAVLARGDLGDVGALVPREHRAQGVADYFDKLDRLVAEPDLRASWLDAQRAYLAEIADPATFAAELSDVCDLAYRRFAERLPIDPRKLFAQ
ncbi:MAG TPA: hypothetical protein VKT30_13830, partial [Caulobacteraceae bacterium]|nr:hypothetical protein [Caulobacteraceae bacterium]